MSALYSPATKLDLYAFFPYNHSMATLTKQTVSKQKTSRLDIRLTDAQRQLIERAAELTAVPDERVLEIYNALRPYRSSKEELTAIADELEQKYQAKICAAFVRQAAGLYQTRKKLKGDD